MAEAAREVPRRAGLTTYLLSDLIEGVYKREVLGGPKGRFICL